MRAAISSCRHAELRLLRPFAYATTPPRKTSLDPARRREPRGDQPARAGLRGRERQARARHSSSTISSIGRSSRANRAPERRRERASSLRPRASAPGSTTRSTWISKSRAQIVASTPSPSPPASSSACATADSLAPKKRARAARAPRERARRTGSLERRRPEPRSSPGGPGGRRRRRPIVLEHDPGSGAGEADADGAFRQRRLLAHAGLEVGVRPVQALGDACARRPRSRARAPGRRRSSRPSTPRESSTVRSSCVGPSPPDVIRRSALEPFAERASSFLAVADDVIRAGSTPSDSTSRARNGPFGSVRSPRTSSLPVTTTSARGRVRRAAAAR